MDRNVIACAGFVQVPASPPARVAWIEISLRRRPSQGQAVATREGGVDRNIIADSRFCNTKVATREGGVDRNTSCAKWG